MDEPTTITGLQETLAALDKLDAAVRGPILKKAAKVGALIIYDAAVAAAPVGTTTRNEKNRIGEDQHPGQLKAAIKIKSANKPSKGYFGATVGMRYADWVGASWYATFALWGHKSQNGTPVQGNDFLRQATLTAGEGAANAMSGTIADEIEKQQKGA